MHGQEGVRARTEVSLLADPQPPQPVCADCGGHEPEGAGKAGVQESLEPELLLAQGGRMQLDLQAQLLLVCRGHRLDLSHLLL